MVRIAPTEISTISPNAWKDLYVCKPILLKDPYSQTQPLNNAHSLFTAYGDTHRRIRGVMGNSFSDKSLRGQSSIIEKYANQLLDRIQREASLSPGGAVDLTKLYGYASFDTITDLSLGEPLAHGLEGLNEHNWIKGYFFHTKFSALRVALARFWPIETLMGFYLLRVTSEARKRNWGVITAAVRRRMSREGKDEHGRVDLLTAQEERLDETATKGITNAELISNGLSFVIAGTQLDTITLSTATYLLLRHRDAWDRLAEEIRGRFDTAEDITVRSTFGLPYLDAVISETLRIRHPTPINLPRVIPSGGHIVDGVKMPANVSLTRLLP